MLFTQITIIIISLLFRHVCSWDRYIKKVFYGSLLFIFREGDSIDKGGK